MLDVVPGAIPVPTRKTGGRVAESQLPIQHQQIIRDFVEWSQMNSHSPFARDVANFLKTLPPPGEDISHPAFPPSSLQSPGPIDISEYRLRKYEFPALGIKYGKLKIKDPGSFSKDTERLMMEHCCVVRQNEEIVRSTGFWQPKVPRGSDIRDRSNWQRGEDGKVRNYI